MSFHENNYVIDRHTGHPGYQDFTIVSTPEHMTALVEALSHALTGRQTSGRLWSGDATISRGKTSRIYLSFAVASDLKPYHVRPGFLERLGRRIGWALVLVVLYFAWVGFSATVQRVIN